MGCSKLISTDNSLPSPRNNEKLLARFLQPKFAGLLLKLSDQVLFGVNCAPLQGYARLPAEAYAKSTWLLVVQYSYILANSCAENFKNGKHLFPIHWQQKTHPH